MWVEVFFFVFFCLLPVLWVKGQRCFVVLLLLFLKTLAVPLISNVSSAKQVAVELQDFEVNLRFDSFKSWKVCNNI